MRWGLRRVVSCWFLGSMGAPTRPDAPRLAKILTLLGPHLLIDLAAPLSRSLGHIDLIQDCGALVTERQERERERKKHWGSGQ